nr:EOG090X04NF [Eulimnadia texana]
MEDSPITDGQLDSEKNHENETNVETNNETGKVDIFTLPILKVIRDAQQQHGLRHGDYQRYRSYCSRRLQRLRKALHFVQGDKKHFKKKEVTVDNLKDERFLYLPLIQAERAWGYAMQLKQEANTEARKKFHQISRLQKAVSHAVHLESLCNSQVCDARTKLEAQAYAAWMQGSLDFELQQWKTAGEKLLLAQTIYEKLSSALNEEEQAVYRQKVEELNPNLRYCAYNIGDRSAQEDLVKMRGQGKPELDTLIAQTREKQAASLLEVTWRKRSVPVRIEKVRLFLLAIQELKSNLAEAADDEAKLSMYESLLLDCKDSVQALKEELQSSAAARAKTEGISSQQHLLNYVTFLRVTLTVDRNLVMLETLKKNMAQAQVFEGKKAPKPQEAVRLYEGIVQLLTELQQLPGLENDDLFQTATEILTKMFKAFRCYFIARTLQGNRQWPEALALYQRAEAYISQTVNKKLTDEDFSSYSSIQKEIAQLTGLVSSGKCAAHAQSILGVDDISTAMGSLSVKSNKTLWERLDEFVEDGNLLTDNPNLIKFPPDMQAVPCKPLFFDLALNHVEFPSLAANMETKKAPGGAGITGFVKGLWGWGGKK